MITLHITYRLRLQQSTLSMMVIDYPQTARRTQLIKAFYRKIPCDEPGYLPQSLLQAQSESDIVDGFAAMSEPRKSLFLWTFDLWIGIEDMKLFNKMTLQSMSIVFSPNMVRTGGDPMVFLELQKKVQSVTLEAAKLRRQRRLIVDGNDGGRNVHLVPFKANRESKEESPEMQYPAISETTSSIGAFFKNCVVL